LHGQAPAWEATDRPQIAGLYAELERLDPSPVVTINSAVAVGFAEGPTRAWRSSTASAPTRDSTATNRWHRRGPSCGAVPATRPAPMPRTPRRSRCRATTPSARRSSGGAAESA
jgi:hypothetical protein